MAFFDIWGAVIQGHLLFDRSHTSSYWLP